MSASKSMKNPHILIAPLDWGLGHATRCIPIIHQLLQQNSTVIIAAEGPVKKLLVAEFPQLSFIPLPGYRIQYAAGKLKLLAKIIIQIPKIIKAIRTEHQWLHGILKQYDIDAILSDNRYGLYNSKVYSVFITHQLTIKSPLGKWSEYILRRINYRFINHFNECWVPDMQGNENLAGELSHPPVMPTVPLRYIGPLSRFAYQPIYAKKHLLILLSGPEPQRTILEHILLQQLQTYTQPVLLVRGLPAATTIPHMPDNIAIKNHLTADQLQTAMAEAFLIIARCGYSTVMDVMALRQKGIFIPTPGQTEQEYLSKHLSQNQYALCIEQSEFDLATALEAAMHFSYRPFPEYDNRQLNEYIRDFVSNT